MKKSLISTIIVILFTMLGFSQFPHDTVWIPKVPEVMPRPEYLEPVLENAYNIDITRISDPVAFNYPAGSGQLLPPYSKIQAWNADMTKIALGFTMILNANDYSIYKDISNAYPGGYYNDGRWSNVDPLIRYFCFNDRFMKINVETEQVDTLQTFPGYAAQIGPFEGNISADDKYVVISDQGGHNASLYNIEEDIVVSTRSFPGGGFDWASITPSGDYIAVSNNITGSTELYDHDFNFIKTLISAQQHADFAIDSEGHEVLVQVTPLSMIRLDNGQNTDLITSALVCGNFSFDPNIAGHISGRNFNNPGWALVSTPIAVCSNDMGHYYATEVFTVKLDGSGTIKHFGHAYTSCTSYDSYSKATISPDGTKVMYSSDWDIYGAIGSNDAMTYVAEVHKPQTELSDEFHNICSKNDWKSINNTEGWNASHLETSDINISNEGQLTLEPWTTAWYNDYRSNFLYKKVSNDFVFTSHVSSTNKAQDGDPESEYSLAGVMVRSAKSITNGLVDWTPGEENYLFLSLGYASTTHSSCIGCEGPHFELKNTINSNSNLNVSRIDTAAALIRIVKIDNAIIVLHKVDGQSFVVAERYTRSDMPNTVQVGLVAYTDWDKVSTYTPSFLNSHTINADLNPDPSNNQNQPFDPDIIAQFDFARFEDPNIPTAMQGLDFADSSVVSDLEILTLFGYTSTSTQLKNWKIWQGSNSNWSNPANWSEGILPSPQDSILIPNCDCPEVVFPIISNGLNVCSSLKIETAGQLTINNGSALTVDLMGSKSRFINQGEIINSGVLTLSNSQNKNSKNNGLITCKSGGQVKVTE